MKTTIFSLAVAASLVSLTSCKKESANARGGRNNQIVTSTSTTINYDLFSNTGCPTAMTPLIAGQHIDAGDIEVTNDAEFIYVTYNTANGYVLTETHLYVGNCEAIPVNNQGNPVPGLFPHKNTHNKVCSYTYKVPISAIPAGTCGCIASHAALVKLNSQGQVVDSQTGWGSGSLINASGGNWGMKFQYCSCQGGE